MGAAIHRRKKPPEPVPSLGHRPGLLSGIHNLNPALTINGVTELPKLRYKGGDAAAGGWAAWGYGPTLALQAGTAPSYNQGSPLLGAYDDSVKGNAGGYFSGTAVHVGAGQDLVFEGFCQATSGSEIIASDREPTTYKGWALYSSGGAFFVAVTQSAVPLVSVTVTGVAWTIGAWFHVMVFINRDGSAQIYVNGVASGAAADVSSVADISGTGAFEILSQQGGALPFGSRLGYFSMWARDAWLDTHLQAAVAKSRFLALVGGIPTIALGTATPTAFGSSSPAHQYKSSASRLYYMGAGVPRFETPSAGFTGLLNEGQVSNAHKYGRLFSSWSKDGSPTITPNADAGPLGDNAGWKIEGIAGSGAVDIYVVSASMGASAVYKPSLWLKRSSTSGVLALAAATGAGKMTVNLANLPDAWVKLHPASSYVTVVAPFQCGAPGVGGLYLYRESGADPLAFFCDLAQAAVGDYAPSDVPTTGTSAVTKAADSYILPASGNVGTTRGAVRFRFCAPLGWTPSARRTLWSLNDGTANNRIDVYIHTDGTLCLESRKTGGTSGDISIAGSVLDGLVHEVLCCWDTGNAIVLYKDGTRGATGGDAPTIPTAPTQISLGQDAAGATNAAPVVVGDFKHFTRSIPSFALKGSGFRW